MIYLLALFVLLFCAALVWVIYSLTKERDFWRGKHDTLRVELDAINHANADANMQRIYGQPIFGDKPEPQKAAKVLLGHDRAEMERQKAMLEPDLTEADIAHLNKIGVGIQ